MSGQAPRIRVFCLPFAAGSASAFGEWRRHLPEWVDVAPVEYPGHGRRFGQPPLAAIEQIAWVLAGDIAAGHATPFALYGHSMGGLVALELARELRRLNTRLPVKVYVSATRSPVCLRTPSPEERLSDLPDDELRRCLIRFGGTPRELLENDELMELMLPIVRADLAACENYRLRPEPPLPCPITALGGVDDTTFDQRELGRWREMTSSDFELVTFPGDHFFVATQRAALLAWLARDLHKML